MPTNEELTSRIIGAAITVHKELGPGFIESIYEESLAVEFDHLDIAYERQKPVTIRYRCQPVGEHRLNFLVEDCVVVELKAVLELEKIFFATTRSYLKATGTHIGLLMNFASMPLTVKRVGQKDLNYLRSHS